MTQVLSGAAFPSPLGLIVAIASDAGLRRVSWDLDDLADVEQADHPVLDAWRAWQSAYFARRFRELPDVALDLPAGPSHDVWELARRIPVGQTRTYGDLARDLGRPQSARAVGAGLGANPVMLIVPCHRVTALSGSLAGYAGGVQRKAWLLRHEGALLL